MAQVRFQVIREFHRQWRELNAKSWEFPQAEQPLKMSKRKNNAETVVEETEYRNKSIFTIYAWFHMLKFSH